MDDLPSDNEHYGSVEYWDERYGKEAPDSNFDWFQGYADLSELIERLVPDRSARICMLGCGNSTLSKDMYDEGFQSIVNIDLSQVLIERMRAQHGTQCSNMTWLQADVRKLPFEDASFDVAIDKGTMDALMCAKGDVWDPPHEVIENCKMEIDEVARILKPSGVFLYITFGQPHFRRRHLERPGIWSLEVIQLGEMFHYYFYAMRKIETVVT